MKRKILFILHFPPPVHGSSVIGGQIKDSQITNGSFKCRYINYGTSFSVEEIGHNPFGKVIRYFSLLWNVLKQLLLFRPDLCYLSPVSKGIGFYKDALIILLVRMFRVKPVYHFHTKGVRHRQDKFFDNLLYRMVFRNADLILLSKHLYQDVSKYVTEERVHYCPNGIDEDIGRRQKAEGRRRKSEGRRQMAEGGRLKAESGRQKEIPSPLTTEILFISHLIESKGVFILVDALKILKEKNIEFHCTMIGGEADISEKQMMLKIEKSGLSDNVLVAGKYYGSDKEKAFQQADIFVHPTFEDCLPLVLLEAMQFSLPIVSTFEGAIPDVVENGKTGFLVIQKDSVALAEKLELLIKNPQLCAQMGAAGRAKYEREFTLEIFERRMVEILEEVGSRN